MILKFSATWCQPCKQLSKALGEHYPDLEVQEFDIGSCDKELLTSYGIRAVPTLVHVETGRTFTGFTDLQTLKEWVDECSNYAVL